MWENIKVIGFDVDQTLYPDTEELSRSFKTEAYKRVVKKFGCSLEEAEEKYNKKLAENKGSNTQTFIDLEIGGKRGINEVLGERDYKNCLKKYNGSTIDKKLIRMLNKLKSQYTLVITTNNTLKGVKKIMGALGVPLETFETIITADDVGEDEFKPHPKTFEMLLDATGAKPGECLYVGDRDTTDIKPAKKTGMKAVIVWGKSNIADASLEKIYDLYHFLWKKSKMEPLYKLFRDLANKKRKY